MKDNIFSKLHETFTDDSNTVIKIEDLLKDIKDKDLDEQNMILMQMLSISESQNALYLKEKKEHEEFLKKRKPTKVEKRKVISVTKVKPSQKEYITDEIKKHQKEISVLINLSFDEFILHLETKEDLELNINFYMLGIIKEITSYQKMADEAYLNKDYETINEIKACTEELQNKLNYLKQWKPEIEESKESQKARIIFMETSSHRSFFMQDVERYTENYDSFCNLLLSIEEDRPKNVRKFYNGTLKGAYESRDLDGQTRIFFEKINDTYIIFNAIIKKEDNTISYRTQAFGRHSMYLQQRQYIINHMNDAEFIERQNNYLKEVKQLFGIEEAIKKVLKPTQGDLK